ncbi:MAG: hypothetical protein AB7U81_02355 [Thiohalomonadaceae bacterium]
MRTAVLIALLPLAAAAGEPVEVPGLDVEANVRAMLEAARREQAVSEGAPVAAPPAEPIQPAPVTPAAATPLASAPVVPAQRAGPPGTAPAHVPLPLKTITIQDLKGVKELADELESARRQAPERR